MIEMTCDQCGVKANDSTKFNFYNFINVHGKYFCGKSCLVLFYKSICLHCNGEGWITYKRVDGGGTRRCEKCDGSGFEPGKTKEVK